jgi:hypothetical protein
MAMTKCPLCECEMGGHILGCVLEPSRRIYQPPNEEQMLTANNRQIEQLLEKP